MLIDITGTILIPGNEGKNCPGNGLHEAECCCDECDYMMCCFTPELVDCSACKDWDCPHNPASRE